MKYTSLLFLFISVLIAGCSDDKQASTEMSEDNVFKGQVDALEKAKTVESTIQASFDERQNQVE